MGAGGFTLGGSNKLPASRPLMVHDMRLEDARLTPVADDPLLEERGVTPET